MILEKMQEINSFLEKKMWVDFCFEKISDNYLKLVGSNDFSWGETLIEIEFKDCIYANILLNTWTKPDNHIFIQLQEKSIILLQKAERYRGCIVIIAESDFYD